MPAKLRAGITRADAKERLQSRIEEAATLLVAPIHSKDELYQRETEESSWHAFNLNLFDYLFEDTSLRDLYAPPNEGAIYVAGLPLQKDISNFRWDIESRMSKLRTVLQSLEFVQESSERQADTQQVTQDENIQHTLSRRVFVVHGHDETALQQVQAYLLNLDLTAIILRDKASGGATVIEKIENNCDVAFAIVLLTGDDLGASLNEIEDLEPARYREALQPRARQNVILELGYFLAHLERRNVVVLYEEGVEIPSDYAGVVYVPLDAGGGCRVNLAKEINHAGIPIDINKLLG